MVPFKINNLTFRNQFIVSSGPATKHIDQLIEAERCGWGGVSLKLAVEPEPYINLPPRYRWWGQQKYLAFSAETRMSTEESLRLVDEGRRRTKDLIILTNITYAGNEGMDGWVKMAKRFEEAGVHAIELNMCCPNMSFNVDVSGQQRRTEQTGASLGQNAQLVGEATMNIVEAVSVPVFVKLTPEGGRIAEVAKACFENGASVVGTTANRLAIPEFDIHHHAAAPFRFQHEPSVACFSGAWIKPLALRDVFDIRRKVGPEFCVLGTGGVRNYVDAVQMMMCGADLVGICTQVMLQGFDFLPRLLKDLKKYLSEQGYQSYRDFRDTFAEAITPVDKLTIIHAHAEINQELCEGCGRCEKIGHCNAITRKNSRIVVDDNRCTGCSTCLDVCPTKAISLCEETVEEVQPDGPQRVSSPHAVKVPHILPGISTQSVKPE